MRGFWKLIVALIFSACANSSAFAGDDLCPSPQQIPAALNAGSSRFCDPYKPRPSNQTLFFLDKCESAASFEEVKEVDRAKCVNRSDNRVLVACMGKVRAMPEKEKAVACNLLKGEFQVFYSKSNALISRYKSSAVSIKALGEAACGGLLEKSVEWLTEDMTKLRERMGELCP